MILKKNQVIYLFMFGVYYRYLASITGTPSAGLVNYQNHNIFH